MMRRRTMRSVLFDVTLVLLLFAAPGTLGDRVLELVRSQVGVPYAWSGITPGRGFDCSGLTGWAYAESGVQLPRTAAGQFTETTRIPAEELRPGDLVFFEGTNGPGITHVGVFAGDGRLVHASSRGGVREETLFTQYWYEHYAGAGRVPDSSGAVAW
jgi:peptidoglycan DL-endopeptidase CwlO